jgi:1-acyl-sn-glycerol-3-phosphate acyltransferase
MYFVGGAHHVKVKGKLASPKEAPILVTAPHSSFFDPLAVLFTGPSSVVGKVEAGEIPFYGSKYVFMIYCSLWRSLDATPDKESCKTNETNLFRPVALILFDAARF